MIREIVKLGHPALRAQNKLVDKISEEIHSLALDLIETVNQADGLGLAAPQIGVNLQVAAIRIGSVALIVCNPKLILNGRIYQSEEGCLSLPRISVAVPRFETCAIEFLSLEGNICNWDLEPYEGRIAQHEIDHLGGILLIDRLDEGQKKRFARAGGEEALIKDYAEGKISALYLGPSPIQQSTQKTVVGRNSPCICNSGKKYKHCCLK